MSTLPTRHACHGFKFNILLLITDDFHQISSNILRCYFSSFTHSYTYCSINLTIFPIDFLEGSECELKDGSLGTCKSFVLCRWAIQGLNQRVISYRDLTRCSFEVHNNLFMNGLFTTNQ